MKQVFTLLLLALCISLAALGGSYTVGGSGADYVTLTDAIYVLNAQGLTAHTEFILNPGTYSGPFVMQHQSRGYNLTIHSGEAPEGSVILNNPGADTANNYIIKIDAVNNVKLHKLSFITSGSYNVAVQINGNSDNASITSCVFQGQANASSNNSGAIQVTASGNGDADNLYISQNSFYDGGYHITCNTGSYDDNFANWEIKNNYFEDGYTSINLLRFTGLKIQGNDIRTTTSGINLASGSGSIEISGNKIGECGKGLYVNYIQTSSQVPHIYNNIIGVNGEFGMSVYGDGLNILHNSVTNSSTNTYNTFAAVFSGSNLKVRKNHFVTTGGGTALSASSVDPQSSQRNIIDHNNLYSYGLYLAKISNDSFRELWEFENVTGTQNVSINPFFSGDLLTTISPALDNMFASTAVTTDYNGLPRDPVNSDIGAHEYTSDPALIPLSGLHNIGVGHQYTSIQAFLDDLGMRGINGSVEGRLTDALYEEQLTAHFVPGVEDLNSVIIRSERYPNPIISYSGQTASQPYIMSLTRTDGLMFSNIVFNTSATNHSNILLLNGFNKNLRFQYMSFNAPANSDGVSLGAISGSEADNLQLFALRFDGNGYGIESRGSNWYTYACVFDNQYQGFMGQSVNDIWIENSTFSNARFFSINISSAQDITILQNRISGTRNGISLGTYGNTDTRSLIANNTVNLQGSNVEGIRISGNKMNVINNSVQVRGQSSKGIYSYDFGTDVDIENNALSSDLGRALEINNFSPEPSKKINYNSYYTEGYFLVKMAVDYMTISDLQSAYPGYNHYSINVNPHFTQDMHTQSPWLRAAGTYRTEISTDMDDEPRGISFDIGADQQTGNLIDTRLRGTYTIGDTGCNYASIQAALDDLELHGIREDVIFNISAGIYPGNNIVRHFPISISGQQVYFNALEGVSFSMLPNNSANENYFFRLVGVKNLNFTGLQMELQAANRQSTFFVLNGRCENISITESSFNLYNPLSSSNTAISTENFQGSNLLVQNCSFEDGDKGISIPGPYNDPTSYTGVEIISNTFSNVNYPISIQKAVDLKIEANIMDAAIQAISLSNISGSTKIRRNRINSSGFSGSYSSYTMVNMTSCHGDFGSALQITNNIINVAQSSAQSITALAITGSSHMYLGNNSIISDNSTYGENGAALSLSNLSIFSLWNNIISAPASGYAATVSGCTDYNLQNNAWYGSGKYVLKRDGILYTAQELLDEIDPDGYFANPLPNANGYSQCSYLRGKGAETGTSGDIDNHWWNGAPDIGASIIPDAGSPFSGTIYAGLFEEYPDLASAWEALQKRGIDSDVVLQLISGPMASSAILGYVPNSLEYSITIRGAESGYPSTLSKTASTEADNYILKLYNTRNLKLQNVSFNAGNPTYSKCVELQRYTNNLEILDCKFQTAANSQTSSYSAALYTSGAMLEDCKMQDSIVQNIPRGISISGLQNQSIDNTGIYISGNNLTGNHTAISLSYVDSPQVLGNIIDDCRGNGIYASTGVKNLSIQTNQVSGNGQGIFLSNLGTGNHELINNFVSTGLAADTSIKVENSPNVRLFHNTIINSSANANAAAFYQGSSSAGLGFINNITVAAAGYAAWFNQYSDFVGGMWTYNLYHSTGANKIRLGGIDINSIADLNILVGDWHNIMADPLLIDGGFELPANSPARDAGIFLPFVAQDILGQQRVAHSDLGCYEYQLSSLPAPQNLQISLSPDQGQITLSWDSVAGAGAYYVQSASDPYALVWQNVPGASTDQLTISLPVPSEAYLFYRVVAIDAQ